MTDIELKLIALMASTAAERDIKAGVERGGMNAAWEYLGDVGYSTEAKIFCTLYLSKVGA